MAPLDGRLFRLRKKLDAVDVPMLVIASLLSKKLAVGVDRVGLDIRVSSWGNFGRDWTTARENAIAFKAVAKSLGITAHPVLTDGTNPYQPYVGRAEALIALDVVLRGVASGDLARHANVCKSIAAATLSRAELPPLKGSDLRTVLYRHLEAQGGSPEGFARIVADSTAAHLTTVRASRSGFVRFSLNELRDIIVLAQDSARSSSRFPDPVGVILLQPTGSWVNAGDELASLRVTSGVDAGIHARLRAVLSEVADAPAALGVESVGA
jgi:pyrimidine-nucleoside phosphorylase